MVITIEIIAQTADLVGVLMIAYMAIRVHLRVAKEHKIDKHIFAEMRMEQAIGIIGASLIITGYILQLPIY